MLVDLQESALIRFEAERIHIECLCSSGAPNAVKRHFGADLFSAGKLDLDLKTQSDMSRVLRVERLDGAGVPGFFAGGDDGNEP